MTITAHDLARALRETLEHGPTSAAHWTLSLWEAQQGKADGGRGLARLLWRDYHYTISQLAQLSATDRRTMAEVYLRYHETYDGGQYLDVETILERWEHAIADAPTRAASAARRCEVAG